MDPVEAGVGTPLAAKRSAASGSRPVIRVRGVRVHNLKYLDADIPHNALVVLTGVSGSGKSSLAFDTLFAEGQRRYLDSLSAYTRQYLHQLERPAADLIDGLPPMISIDQWAGTARPRSTLATTTEISDYLRLLYARAGQAHCTGCGRSVSRQSAQAIVDRILALEDRRKVMILAPLVRGRRGAHRKAFETIAQAGFVRARVDGEIVDVAAPPSLDRRVSHDVEAVVDRVIIKEGLRSRLQDSVNLALRQGDGTCLVSWLDGETWRDRLYSEKFACPDCGLSFPELEPRSFSASSPYGACPVCDGLGFGTSGEEGALDLSKPCLACGGSRLNPFSRRVTVAEVGIAEVAAMTVADAAGHLREVVQTLKTSGNGTADAAETAPVAERTIPPILSRLDSLLELGLDYLTLDRPSRTLSGGEFQRARLAASLGSGLTGVCYVLDEPTIGLHATDTQRLIDTLARLKEQGNTVLVVEHDVGLMRQADWLLDLGPGAGVDGGRLVAAGLPADVAKHTDSQTARFLRNGRALLAQQARREIDPQRSLMVLGARLHNLQDLTLRLPLGVLMCVTGVSGSGKSSLVSETLVPAVRRALAGETLDGLPLDGLDGVEHLDRLVEVDQSPLGRTSRSNPATYSGVWDQVRRVFAQTRESRLRGYTARRFSFNARDGRCDACHGQGTRRIEMHFMPDVHVTCPVCRGNRFNPATLAVRYAGKTVADVLRMRIDEAAGFFQHFPKIATVLTTFAEVGLGYLQLGQSSLTLSGGEAQRVRLATELSRGGESRTLFVLDEPTRGLHPADVERLLGLLNGLVDRGHAVIVVEHQLDVIAAADWVIDLGPGSGRDGGRLVAEGAPEIVARAESSATGRALAAAG